MNRVIRVLRLKYGITVRELAKNAGISHQYLYQLECGETVTALQRERMKHAFEKAIFAREDTLNRLKADFARCQNNLFDFWEETDGI